MNGWIPVADIEALAAEWEGELPDPLSPSHNALARDRIAALRGLVARAQGDQGVEAAAVGEGARLTDAEMASFPVYARDLMVWNTVERILAARAAVPVEAGLAERVAALADEYEADAEREDYGGELWSATAKALRALLRPAPAADGGADQGGSE